MRNGTNGTAPDQRALIEGQEQHQSPAGYNGQVTASTSAQPLVLPLPGFLTLEQARQIGDEALKLATFSYDVDGVSDMMRRSSRLRQFAQRVVEIATAAPF